MKAWMEYSSDYHEGPLQALSVMRLLKNHKDLQSILPFSPRACASANMDSGTYEIGSSLPVYCV